MFMPSPHEGHVPDSAATGNANCFTSLSNEAQLIVCTPPRRCASQMEVPMLVLTVPLQLLVVSLWDTPCLVTSPLDEPVTGAGAM